MRTKISANTPTQTYVARRRDKTVYGERVAKIKSRYERGNSKQGKEISKVK